MVIMCIRRRCRCVLLCERENRTDHRRDAGRRDVDGRYTLCGEEVQMHGGVVRPRLVGWRAVRYLSMQQCATCRVNGRNACGSHPYGVAASGGMLGVDGVLGSLKPGKRASVLRWIAGCMCNKSGFRVN